MFEVSETPAFWNIPQSTQMPYFVQVKRLLLAQYETKCMMSFQNPKSETQNPKYRFIHLLSFTPAPENMLHIHELIFDHMLFCASVKTPVKSSLLQCCETDYVTENFTVV